MSERPIRRISRRDFLKTAGAGAGGMIAASAAGGLLAGCTGTSTVNLPAKWDNTADIVVVGTGAAGNAAAAVAHAQGASVIMLEKGAAIGGTAMKSGGMPWIPNNRFLKAQNIIDNRGDCLKFMARGNYPQNYNPADAKFGLTDYEYNHLAAFYDNASAAIDYFMQIGACQFVLDLIGDGKPPPDYLDHVPENKVLRGRLIAPANAQGSIGFGADLVKNFRNYIDNAKIPTLLSHRVNKIYVDDNNRVVGVQAARSSGTTAAVAVNVKSNKAVIFASGGYTHNKEYIVQFQKGPTFGGCAVSTNEGDFIPMAQALGAQIYNMNGAWNAEIPLEQALQTSSTPNDIWQPVGDSMIYVNKYGVRVTNEKRDYNDRTKIHFYWDPIDQEYPNEIVCMIYDQRLKDVFGAGPVAYPVTSGTNDPAEISGQTWRELATNITNRVNSLGGKIGNWRIAPGFEANLTATIDKFNQYANSGKDLDFHRGEFPYDVEWYPVFSSPAKDTKWPAHDKPNITMYPFQPQGPYYCYLIAAGTLDTNGGPKVNEKCQVVNTSENPISGLYAAGNCSAVFMPYYIGGGATIGNALTMGYVAGMNAAKEPAK